MMNDYISRQKAIEIINHYAEMALYRMLSLEPGSRAYLIAELQYGDRKHIRKMVEGIPAVDVRQAVYGEWEITSGQIENAVCSCCGAHFQSYYSDYQYCPRCGADMRGKVNE